MIDPTTGWFKIGQYNNKYSYTTANVVEQGWLCRYPQPTIITYDCGK